jgi:hypothetical protein
MPFQFPNTPTIGQSVLNPTSSQYYTWNGTAWTQYPTSASYAISSSFAVTSSYAQNGGGGGATITIGDNAPTGSAATTGSMWFNSTNLGLYVRYQDTDSTQWVAASAVGPVSTASFAQTASLAQRSISSSFATTASYVFIPGGGSVLVQVTGSWVVPTGGNTNVSFTVDPNASYIMWMWANIPNGIVAWNASCTISNTNVPVVGSQYAWVYNGGGSTIDLISITDQFTGTNNTIVRSAGGGTNPTNAFRFTLRNVSGANQTFYYGYTKM